MRKSTLLAIMGALAFLIPAEKVLAETFSLQISQIIKEGVSATDQNSKEIRAVFLSDAKWMLLDDKGKSKILAGKCGDYSLPKGNEPFNGYAVCNMKDPSGEEISATAYCIIPENTSDGNCFATLGITSGSRKGANGIASWHVSTSSDGEHMEGTGTGQILK